jgi:catechol 2,3-dioxygenase-like lactoylglutathione lyase family enzyme
VARGIDHIVHAVRDLDAAAALYRGLGFTVGARNKHPWGTHNTIVQFPGSFIELLSVGGPERVPEHTPGHFSFGAFNRDFLRRTEGLSMLVLEGKGAADVTQFEKAGIADGKPFDFEREARRPDGTAIKVAFTLAFARDPAAPQAGFFTCQQHYPENFWNPAYQNHANSVTGVAGVVIVAGEPAAHRGFIESFAGAAANPADGGLSVTTPRGAIDILTPEAFTRRYGVAAPDTSSGARLAAVRFAAADAGLLQSVPQLSGMAGLYAGNPAVIGMEDAMGAVLVFEPGRA